MPGTAYTPGTAPHAPEALQQRSAAREATADARLNCQHRVQVCADFAAWEAGHPTRRVVHDVRDVARSLRERGARAVAVVGLGWGCCAALACAESAAVSPAQAAADLPHANQEQPCSPRQVTLKNCSAARGQHVGSHCTDAGRQTSAAGEETGKGSVPCGAVDAVALLAPEPAMGASGGGECSAQHRVPCLRLDTSSNATASCEPAACQSCSGPTASSAEHFPQTSAGRTPAAPARSTAYVHSGSAAHEMGLLGEDAELAAEFLGLSTAHDVGALHGLVRGAAACLGSRAVFGDGDGSECSAGGSKSGDCGRGVTGSPAEDGQGESNEDVLCTNMNAGEAYLWSEVEGWDAATRERIVSELAEFVCAHLQRGRSEE